MSRPRILSRTPIRLAAALLLFCLFTLEARAQQWLEIRSPHFSVVTNGGEKRGREVALRFEQMRSVFGNLFLKDKVNLPVPLEIIAFRNTREMRQYVGLWNGKPIEVAGLFQGGEDRNFILLDLSLEEKWTTVFHEYAHLLLNGNLSVTAPWFDEGFAEFYSTMRISNKDVEVGRPPEYAAHTLLHARLMPVVDLFSVLQDSKVYNESGDRRQLFYAQSWLLVHYIFERKELPAVGEYLQLAKVQNVPVAEAIRRAFHREAKQLDQELADYLQRGWAGLWKLPLQVGLDNGAYQATSLDPLDAQVVLADLHLHSRDYQEKAIPEFDAVLRARPDDAAAHRGLGYAYLRKGDFAKAEEHFRRAAQLHSRDARVQYYAALLIQRRAQNEPIAPQDAAAMKQHLETAIALDPGLADAYNLLAAASLAAGDREAAVGNMKKALELNPRDQRYALNLAFALLQAGQFDEATPLLLRLKESPQTSVARNAESLLEQLERYQQATGKRAMAQPPPSRESYDAPQWRRTTPAPTEQEEEERPAEPLPAAPPTAPVKYLRGQLLSVDCSSAPAAILTIRAGPRTWRMMARDASKLIVIGADQLSCSWKNMKVAANYREGGQADADLVSLEVQ